MNFSFLYQTLNHLIIALAGAKLHLYRAIHPEVLCMLNQQFVSEFQLSYKDVILRFWKNTPPFTLIFAFMSSVFTKLL